MLHYERKLLAPTDFDILSFKRYEKGLLLKKITKSAIFFSMDIDNHCK